MRMTLVRRAVDGVGTAIGADHALRMRENALEILFAHREPDHSHLALATLEQGDRKRVRLQLLSLCKTPKSLAVSGSVGVVRDPGDLDVVPPANELDLRDRLVANLLRRRGIIQ